MPNFAEEFGLGNRGAGVHKRTRFFSFQWPSKDSSTSWQVKILAHVVVVGEALCMYLWSSKRCPIAVPEREIVVTTGSGGILFNYKSQ